MFVCFICCATVCVACGLRTLACGRVIGSWRSLALISLAVPDIGCRRTCGVLISLGDQQAVADNIMEFGVHPQAPLYPFADKIQDFGEPTMYMSDRHPEEQGKPARWTIAWTWHLELELPLSMDYGL